MLPSTSTRVDLRRIAAVALVLGWGMLLAAAAPLILLLHAPEWLPAPALLLRYAPMLVGHAARIFEAIVRAACQAFPAEPAGVTLALSPLIPLLLARFGARGPRRDDPTEPAA